MDAILEILSWFIPDKDKRLGRWKRIGLFVGLSFAAVAFILIGLWALRS